MDTREDVQPFGMPVLPAGSDAADLRLWAQTAEAGERIVYHQGDLANDRDEESKINRASRAAAAQVELLAITARRLQANGTVILAQRRLGEGRWAYIAIKRGPQGLGSGGGR